MRKWFTSLVLVIALGGGLVGVSAPQGEGECPIANMPDCCKKAQSAGNTAEVSMARLCCNLNCSEPGSGGSSNSSTFSSQQGSVLTVAVVPNTTPIHPIQFSLRYSRANTLHDANPKYIQHLALLI